MCQVINKGLEKEKNPALRARNKVKLTIHHLETKEGLVLPLLEYNKERRMHNSNVPQYRLPYRHPPYLPRQPLGLLEGGTKT